MQCSKILNWKAPGQDGIQGFWVERLDKLHGRIATQLNEILEGTKEIPSWLTFGRTVLCQKDAETNYLSSAYVEVTYGYCFRRHVLLYGK